MRNRFASLALTVAMGAAALGVAACAGGGDGASSPASAATTAARPATAATSSAAPRCQRVPRTTVRLIASRGGSRTRFNARDAAAVDSGSGYAVSLLAIAGGRQRMGTWFVDKLRAPQVVTSGNVPALQITNWPLESLAAEPARQSRICAADRLRGAGPVSP